MIEEIKKLLEKYSGALKEACNDDEYYQLKIAYRDIKQDLEHLINRNS